MYIFVLIEKNKIENKKSSFLAKLCEIGNQKLDFLRKICEIWKKRQNTKLFE